jgi:hypothetical protein
VLLKGREAVRKLGGRARTRRVLESPVLRECEMEDRRTVGAEDMSVELKVLRTGGGVPTDNGDGLLVYVCLYHPRTAYREREQRGDTYTELARVAVALAIPVSWDWSWQLPCSLWRSINRCWNQSAFPGG